MNRPGVMTLKGINNENDTVCRAGGCRVKRDQPRLPGRMRGLPTMFAPILKFWKIGFITCVVNLALLMPTAARADSPYWLLEVNCVPDVEWFFVRNIFMHNLGGTTGPTFGQTEFTFPRYINLDWVASENRGGKVFSFTCPLSDPLEVEINVYSEDISMIPTEHLDRSLTRDKRDFCYWDFNATISIRNKESLFVDKIPFFQPHRCRGDGDDEKVELISLHQRHFFEPTRSYVSVGLTQGEGHNALTTIVRNIWDIFPSKTISKDQIWPDSEVEEDRQTSQ